MADVLPEPAYVAGLATTLSTTRPDLLRAAEIELSNLRHTLARVADWINNPTQDRDARTNLAECLGLPTPRTERTTPE